MDELVKRLHLYTENCVAYKLDADFASAVQEAADAIEELEKAVNFHKFNSEFWEDKYNSLADEKWIPVTERLPRDRQFVLVYCGDNKRIRPSDRFDVAILLGDSIFTSLGVTHWMPLPEPPKEE